MWWQSGTEDDMLLCDGSALPVALLILAFALHSLRMVIIPFINIGAPTLIGRHIITHRHSAVAAVGVPGHVPGVQCNECDCLCAVTDDELHHCHGMPHIPRMPMAHSTSEHRLLSLPAVPAA